MSEKIVGLSLSESKVYRAILKLKTATVRELSQKTGLHRTNIYDILEADLSTCVFTGGVGLR